MLLARAIPHFRVPALSFRKTYAGLISGWHDGFRCSAKRVRRQANRSTDRLSKSASFAVAIPHYNRGDSIHRPLCNLLDHASVAEIVVFDDASDPEQFAALQSKVDSLGARKKTRVLKRETNKGAQWTKLDAVRACQTEWVLLLDSDNTAFRSYLSELESLGDRDSNTIYCSPSAFPYFSFRPFAGRTLSFEDCCALTRNGELRRVFIINDGNYLVHRETYLQRIGPLAGLGSDVADVMVANYKWLSDGGRLHILNRGAYHHRIDASSFWMRTADESRERVLEIFRLFEQGTLWQAGGKEQIYPKVI